MCIDGEQFRRDRARHHQPLGMLIDDMRARERKLTRRGYARHVNPRVHAHAGCVRLQDRLADRIEPLRRGHGIAFGLHEQRVEARG